MERGHHKSPSRPIPFRPRCIVAVACCGCKRYGARETSILSHALDQAGSSMTPMFSMERVYIDKFFVNALLQKSLIAVLSLRVFSSPRAHSVFTVICKLVPGAARSRPTELPAGISSIFSRTCCPVQAPPALRKMVEDSAPFSGSDSDGSKGSAAKRRYWP